MDGPINDDANVIGLRQTLLTNRARARPRNRNQLL
jgi:hypothetical protein